jgi:hypothetical protein
MKDNGWEILTTVAGAFQAEILGGLLEAQGVPVILLQESAGQYAYPVNIGKLGQVEVYVPAELLQEARQVLADYEAGVFQAPEEPEPDPDEE